MGYRQEQPLYIEHSRGEKDWRSKNRSRAYLLPLRDHLLDKTVCQAFLFHTQAEGVTKM